MFNPDMKVDMIQNKNVNLLNLPNHLGYTDYL